MKNNRRLKYEICNVQNYYAKFVYRQIKKVYTKKNIRLE